MAEFRLIQRKPWNRRRELILLSLSFAGVSALPLYNIFSRGEIMHGLTIILVIVLVIVNLDRLTKKAASKREQAWRYLLVIDDMNITCTYADGETTRIEKNAITSVLKEGGNEGIRINGINGIFISNHIENFEEAKRLVIEMTPAHLLDPDGQIRAERSESIFQILSDVSANFTNLSILSIVIVLVGYFKLITYYSFFDISINSYLDPTEVILAFSYQWKEILGMLLCMIVLQWLFGWIRLKTPDPQATFVNRYYLVVGTGLYGSMVYFFSSAYSSLISSFEQDQAVTDVVDKQFEVIPEIFFIVFLLAATLVSASVLFWHRPKIITARYTIFAALFITALIMYAENVITHDCIERGFTKYDVTLMAQGEELIKTNQQLVLIGSTHNYYFFRDLVKHENVIIAKEAVTEERIKQVRIGL